MPPALLNKGRFHIPTTIPIREPAAEQTVRIAPVDLSSVAVSKAADEFSGLSQEALEEGGASLLAGGGLTGSIASFESAAASLSALAPIGIVATDLGGLAIGLIDAFGGDVSIPTYATTPQLDATTELGRAAARKQAVLIRQSLQDSGSKFGFKGLRVESLDPFAQLDAGGF